MTSAAASQPSPDGKMELFDSVDTLKKIRATHSRELVIGLCGPIGTPLRTVAESLKGLLHRPFDYSPELIKLSKFIEEHKGAVPDGSDKHARYQYLINKGNEMRSEFGPAVLAELAVKQIVLRRAEEGVSNNSQPKPIRFCHILDSIKNTEELELLRLVYRDLFILVGVHSSPDQRTENLIRWGVQPKHTSALIDRDSGEDLAHGQEVRKVFPKADFFLNTTGCNEAQIDDKLRRLLSLAMHTEIATPTPDETSMYHAYVT